MIDLRSDTVTRPSKAMREAMVAADVGDDVLGEDPTVNHLQEKMAELLGKEDALFTPSGVMANQIAIRCHTEPGDEVVVERHSHILNYETAAPSLISGVQLLPVEGKRGIFEVDQLRDVVRSSEYYMPRTSLICVENTHNMAGGAVIPLEAMAAVKAFADERRIRVHLDGARIWNAWVASGVHPRDYCRQADTVSVCFSKGLGAPAGSLLAGSRTIMAKARKTRKVLGGGMRQIGILAAAAFYAVEHNIERLNDDHEHARTFARILSERAGHALRCEPVDTNIVLIDIAPSGRTAADVRSRLADQGVLVIAAGTHMLRAVTHLDVARDEVRTAAEIFAKVMT
ncbi:MAG: aminotransferase class I/II-fold pyridoxal phosphate-dependent enzyme [Ignavibacteriales bacterium]|nr:aminotransferase class I/II-fold pyridoxal phosphate-dependent enzyme [Ignavibacteriales bacterium]